MFALLKRSRKSNRVAKVYDSNCDSSFEELCANKKFSLAQCHDSALHPTVHTNSDMIQYCEENVLHRDCNDTGDSTRNKMVKFTSRVSRVMSGESREKAGTDQNGERKMSSPSDNTNLYYSAGFV